MMKGKFIFLTGPSGVGKGTILYALMERHPDWVRPLSVRTRAPRPGEQNGVDSWFMTKDEFHQKIQRGEFLEYAEYAGEYYGTLIADVENTIKNGLIGIKEIEAQGAVIAHEKLNKNDSFGIFIKPAGGTEDLVRRIKSRAPISEEELEKRVKQMEYEFEVGKKYFVHQVLSYEGEIERQIKDTETIILNELKK